MTTETRLATAALLLVPFIAYAGDTRTWHGELLELENSGHVTSVAAGSLSGDTTFTLPASNGTSGQFLSTDGSGELSWLSGVPGTRTLTTTSPLTGGGALSSDLTIAIPAATSGQNGYLSSADWTTFNGKVSTTRAINTTAPLSGGGDLSVDRTLSIPAAGGSQNGYLSSSDWTTFNGKLTSPLTSAGDLLYGASLGAATRLAAGTSVQVLHSGTTPSWASVSLTADVSGVLPTANGGTGVSSSATFPGSGTVETFTNSGTVQNKTFDNSNTYTVLDGSNFTFEAVSDNTKKIQFSLTNIGAGATRTISWPNADLIVTGTATTQVLTNKSLDGGSNTFTNIPLSSAVTGALPVANGGTGQATALAGYDALAAGPTGTPTKGDVLAYGTSNSVRLPVGSNGQVLSADSTQTSGLKWVPAGTGSVTSVALTAPAIFSVSGSPVTTSGTLALAASGTSGGVPYFDSSTTLASSALLTNNTVTLGGGAAGAPKSLALGTANQILGMNSGATANEYKTFSTGTSGTDFAIANAANSVAFNLPDAGASARGLVTTGAQTFAGNKNFNGDLNNKDGFISTQTSSGNGFGVFTSFQATSVAASGTAVYDVTANGNVLGFSGTLYISSALSGDATHGSTCVFTILNSHGNANLSICSGTQACSSSMASDAASAQCSSASGGSEKFTITHSGQSSILITNNSASTCDYTASFVGNRGF